MSQVEESVVPLDGHASKVATAKGAHGLGARIVRRFIAGLEFGRLRVVLPSGAVVEKAGLDDGPDAVIVVNRWRMLRRLIASGDIGFAEAYMDGDWTTPDLTSVIRLAARNNDALAPAITGSMVMRLANRIFHMLHPNTRKGAR